MNPKFYQSAVLKSTKKEKTDFLFDLYPCLHDSVASWQVSRCR